MINPTSAPIRIGSKTYRFYVFRQDPEKRTDMSQPCDRCHIGRDNPICNEINCITGTNFLYLIEIK